MKFSKYRQDVRYIPSKVVKVKVHDVDWINDKCQASANSKIFESIIRHLLLGTIEKDDLLTFDDCDRIQGVKC